MVNSDDVLAVIISTFQMQMWLSEQFHSSQEEVLKQIHKKDYLALRRENSVTNSGKIITVQPTLASEILPTKNATS